MDLIQLILFILPAYVANSVPVVLGGKTPIDFGAKLPDGNRLLGKGKTYRGLLAGVVSGTLVAIILAMIVPNLFIPAAAQNQKYLVGFALSLGAMLGDIIGSFIKRRRGMKQSQESFLMDKVAFLITALIIAFPFYSPAISLNAIDIILLLIITFVLHKFFNWIAFETKLKKVPW